MPANTPKMMSIDPFILTNSLDYNFTKTNSSGLLLSPFIPLKRPSLCAVNLQNKLKNSAAIFLAMETNELLKTAQQTPSRTTCCIILTFQIPPQVSQRLSGQYVGEHVQL